MRMRHLVTQIRRLWRPVLSFAVAIVAFGRCIEWKQPMQTSQLSIASYISAVQTASGDANAVIKAGAPPSAGSGPAVTAPIPALVLLGGTIQVTAAAATPFSTVDVVVPGVNDYWELTLSAPTTSAQLLIVFSQDIPKTQFDVRLGGGFAGTFGTYQQSSVGVIAVGTGDVQVNVTWDSPADLDLHVVDPMVQEIYWASRTSSSGGQLDLDSNAACATDGPRAENIFWASGLIAPHGDYLVRVDQWSNCGASRTNYVVTVNARGRPPQVLSGFFIGRGDNGGKGSGRTITTLTY